jgi:sugar phosphate isomerase/epimerase
MKFGICNEIFKDWNLPDAMAFAKQAGYDAIEIAPFTIAKYVTEISEVQRAGIKATAKQAGIAISGIHWVLIATEGFHLTHPEEEVRERTSNYYVELVNFCADIGGRFVINGSPKQRNLANGITAEQGRAWAREVLQPAVNVAEDRDVTICFEPLAPSETNFINTAADAIEFAREFNSPALSVILDVKAMSSEGRPVPDIIRASKGGFAYFHANDANLKGPGFGDVDFRPIVTALKDVGYDGYVSVEVFKFEEGAEAIATRSIDYLKKTFGPQT